MERTIDSDALESERRAPLATYLAGLRQRRRQIFLVGAAIFCGAIALAILIPSVYRSTAVILIEQQEIPQDLVRSTVSSYADQRIQIISQRVMTTANLMNIVEKYELYKKERGQQPREVILQDMREDIQLEMISADVVDPRSGRPTQATIAFSLSFESLSAPTAQRVANELVTLYLDENIKSRTEMAEKTSTFLEDTAERLRSQVAELESKLAEFKERNVGRLPELVNLNMELMNRAEAELVEVERRIGSYEHQLIQLEGQLAQIPKHSTTYSETGQRILSPEDRLLALEAEYISLLSRYGDKHPDVIRMSKEMDALRRNGVANASRKEISAMLVNAKADLLELQDVYSDAHPDVKASKARVSELEMALDGHSAPSAATVPVAEAPDNPSYIHIRAQANGLAADLASLKTVASGLRAKISDYEDKLISTPQVEREYRILLRDYENAVAKYREITAKQMEAKVSESLETERKGERFTLIEPPLLPEKPAKPNRLALLLLGGILALSGGLGSAGIAETLDDKVRGREGIQKLSGKPPIGVIPVMRFVEVNPGSKHRRRILAAIAIVVLAAIGLLTIHFLFMPIDVFWFAALRRLGL